MTFQPTCISADTAKCLHDSLLAMRRPSWLRAMSAFTRSVDTTAPALEITPPPYYTAVNPCPLSAGNATGGGKICVPTAGHSTPALISTSMNMRAHSPRATRFSREPIAPWPPLAAALARPQRRAPKELFRVALPLFIRGRPGPTSVVPGKILSPIRVFRGRITVGARPRLPWFLRRTRRLLPRCEKDIPISKE